MRQRTALLPRRLATIAAVVIVAIAAGTGVMNLASAGDTVALPATIPAVQGWSAGTGTYTFTSTSRVVAGDATLQTSAEQLAGDLRAVTGYPVPVTSGPPAADDIVLISGSFGTEGYQLAITGTATISGTAPGVFYGTQTLLQLLKQSLTLPRGTANDAPAYPDRAVMVDVARKFYSISWLKSLIRELGWLKYNRLHLHLTDDQAFRLESSSHPEAVSADHYTKAQISDLVAYAARYQVMIVPEIDMPGHMTRLLDGNPGVSLLRSNGNRSLDLSQDGAWTLASELLNEYLPLFPGPDWHLGADEWLSTAELSQFPQLRSRAQALFGPDATGRDLQYDFVNKANALVRAKGKTLRIWNDQLVAGTVVTVDRTVLIDHWYGATDVTPQSLSSDGYGLINSNWNELYSIIGGTRPNAQTIYESFAPHQFAHGALSSTDPNLRGTQLSLWGEPGQDEPEASVAANLAAPLRSLSQVTWGSPKPAPTYSAFRTISDAVGDPPPASSPSPGVVASSSMGTHEKHVPANMVDGDQGTYYWSDSGATNGSWIQVDLGQAGPITSVHLTMSSSSQPGDYIHEGVLEVSGDGTTWTSLGSFTTPEVKTTTSTTGRYVRYRATADQPDWVLADEFTVTTERR